MQRSSKKVAPAALAFAAATACWTPSCIQTTLSCRAIASSTTEGTWSLRRKTSTMSTFTSDGIAARDGYAYSPRTTGSIGFTGKIR